MALLVPPLLGGIPRGYGVRRVQWLGGVSILLAAAGLVLIPVWVFGTELPPAPPTAALAGLAAAAWTLALAALRHRYARKDLIGAGSVRGE